MGGLMRIGLMVRHLEEQGGIAVYTRELLSHLFELDRENEYVAFFGDRGSLGRFSAIPNVHELLIPCRSKFVWDQIQVPREAQRRKIEILFGPKMSIPLFFAGRKVVTFHGAEQLVFPNEFSLLDRFYVRVFLGLYARTADRILTVSMTARDDLAAALGISRDKFKVVYHGAKDVFFGSVSASRIRSVRARYGLGGTFVLHVGLLWGAKNFSVLPKVLELLNQRGNFVLAHAGKAHRWGKKQSTDSKSPYLRELGFVPDEDLAALYHGALALVFPSLYEGFGIPLIEAMASGCPVVTTNWGAMKEVTGSAAIQVDPRCPDEIASAVLKIADDSECRERLRAAGHERAENFRWSATARHTLDAFRKLGVTARAC
jgi:glycosyltransferase involved in cell wall biosynthesis